MSHRYSMRIALVLSALGAVLPAAAFAQSPQSDIGYCKELAARYVHYIGRSEAGPYHDIRRGSLDGQVASVQCQQGQTAEAIPVLEQKLRNGRVNLPPRG